MTVTGTATGASSPGGLTFVPSSGGVVTLNYYDGRFLRADDLNQERRGQREYGELSNRARGAGSVWGFDVSGLGTPELRLSAGLALSPRGRVLYLPDDVVARVTDLLAAGTPSGGASSGSTSSGSTSSGDTSGGAPSGGAGFTACDPAPATSGGGTALAGTALYLVCLGPASLPQGVAEVFGRLCEGCATATDSPYLVDGVTVQLRPLALDLQPWTMPGLTRPDRHLRSQVASAWFEQERQAAGPAMGAALLASAEWGAGAASLGGDDAVAVGVLGWDGAGVVLLDGWTARREILQGPPATYWGGRLEQRPEAAFLAQVLQFQGQLAAAPAAPAGSGRQLVDRGFVELPPAGYLPVPVGAGDLRARLAAQFGPGVELRLCAVRRDQIPREFERGQHRERISLLHGLRDSAARELVDVLVPDGVLAAAAGGRELALEVAVGEGWRSAAETAVRIPRGTARGRGAARWEPGPGIELRLAVALAMPLWSETFLRLLRGRQEGVSGFEAFGAGTGSAAAVDVPDVAQLRALAERVAAATAGARAGASASAPVPVGTLRVLSVAASLSVDDDPFALPDGGTTRFTLEASGYQPSARPASTSALVQVSGTLVRVSATAAGAVTVAVSGVYGLTDTTPDGGGGRRFENRTLQLTRAAWASDGGQEVTVTDPASGLAVRLRRSGDPVRAELLLMLGEAGDTAAGGAAAGGAAEGGPDAPTTVAALGATEDPAVLRPGNVHHDTAATALAMVAAAHPDDPHFAERTYRQLFPPDDAGTATVQARRDWVLFRRRERKDCEGAPVTEAGTDTVTVQVLTVPDAAQAARAVDVLLAGSRDWPQGWTPADVVFDGGTTTLLTPAQSWRLRYRDAGGADAVALAGYAPAAGSLGALVGAGRLKALLAALAPEVGPDPGAPVVAVDPPLPLAPGAGTDGSVFLVTHPPAPPSVPRLAVRAVLTKGNEVIVSRLKKPDATLATDGAAFSALGEGGVDTLDLDRVITELGAFEGDLTDRWLEVETVLWTYDPLPAEVAEDLAQLARAVEAKVAGMPHTRVTSGQRSSVRFLRTDDDRDAQLFLLVTFRVAIE